MPIGIEFWITGVIITWPALLLLGALLHAGLEERGGERDDYCPSSFHRLVDSVNKRIEEEKEERKAKKGNVDWPYSKVE